MHHVEPKLSENDKCVDLLGCENDEFKPNHHKKVVTSKKIRESRKVTFTKSQDINNKKKEYTPSHMVSL